MVAFPTETVYGLGANALDACAVGKIFALKGRPASSPLIVHVSSIEMARALVTEWPAQAEELARSYWPGPLTLVLPKAAAVPDIVTAALPTVGVRVPAHPIALELIEAAGVPIAAPSANRFGGLSPTTAEHVRMAFGDAVQILDGGPTDVGINAYSYVPKALLLSVTGGFSLAGGTNSTFRTTTYQTSDDVSLVRGSHQMSFGANIAQSRSNTNSCTLGWAARSG